MSLAVALWEDYQALKAADAALPERGRVYRRWFAQAFREGSDPSRMWPGHIPHTELRPWFRCNCQQCKRKRDT